MQVNMHEAKSQLSRLVDLACSGEEIILAKHGDPVARIIRYENVQTPRPLGIGRGVAIVAEDFDAPMTDAEVDEFLGL
jgi:prevent-host-death family protein